MKKLLLAAALIFTAAVWSYEFKQLPRSIKISGKLEKITSITVVKDAYSQEIRLAATELCYALKELCNFDVKESATPVKNSFNIIVGNGKLIKAAGITEETHTWAGWRELGYEVIHESKTLYRAILADPATKKGTRTACYFGMSQVQPIPIEA